MRGKSGINDEGKEEMFVKICRKDSKALREMPVNGQGGTRRSGSRTPEEEEKDNCQG